MSEANKTVVRRLIEECMNTGNFQHIGELLANNYTYHEPTVGDLHGQNGLRRMMESYRTAFPDLHMKIDRQFADGDTVITEWTGTGTHRGELFGVRATNKHCNCSGVLISRFSNGKVVEDREQWDVAGLLRQIGALPSSIKVAA